MFLNMLQLLTALRTGGGGGDGEKVCGAGGGKGSPEFFSQ